jgi:hypothetical protein
LADFHLLLRALALIDKGDAYAYDELLIENQQRALMSGLDSSPIYLPLMKFLERNIAGFYGTYSHLYNELRGYLDDYPCEWPRNPKSLSEQLKRDAPALRKMGITVRRDQQRKREGYWVAIEYSK